MMSSTAVTAIFIPVALPGFPGVQLYLKDESSHPTGSLKHRLARSLFLHALCNGQADGPTFGAALGLHRRGLRGRLLRLLDETLHVSTLALDPTAEGYNLIMSTLQAMPEVAEVTMRPENTIELTGEDAERMQKLLDVIEDLDDVQDVFHNAEIDA